MSGNAPGKNITAVEVVAAHQLFMENCAKHQWTLDMKVWRELCLKMFALKVAQGYDKYGDRVWVKEEPKRMGNRKEARSAPKKIKVWREDWRRIKAREAAIYRRGNTAVGPRLARVAQATLVGAAQDCQLAAPVDHAEAKGPR